LIEELAKEERYEYLDVAKGIGIVLVIIGHIVFGNNYKMFGAKTISNLIYSFHMPLFFLISGMCIKSTKTFNKSSLKKMTYSYIVPYVIWTIIYIVIFYLIYLIGDNNTTFGINSYKVYHAVTLCGLAPLWFLLALFVAEIMVLWIKSILDKGNKINYRKVRNYRVIRNVAICILIVIVSIICSYFFNKASINNLFLKNMLWGTLRIFPTILFVLVGYILKEHIHKLLRLKLFFRLILITCLSGIQIFLCLKWNESIDVQLFQLGNPLLYFVKAINGSLVVLLLSQVIHSKLLVYIGKKTKELMILHYPPFFYTLIISCLLDKMFSPNIIGLLIIFVVTISCCLFIDWLMCRFRFWDVMMGKNYRGNM